MVNKPCCPSRISCTNVKTATQKTGVMSTPNAGGTNPLTARRSGSVTTVKISQGMVVILTSGYQLSTTRANMATDMRFKKGSSTYTAGCTQGSAAVANSSSEEQAAVEDDDDDDVVKVVLVAEISVDEVASKNDAPVPDNKEAEEEEEAISVTVSGSIMCSMKAAGVWWCRPPDGGGNRRNVTVPDAVKARHGSKRSCRSSIVAVEIAMVVVDEDLVIASVVRQALPIILWSFVASSTGSLRRRLNQ